jgi:gamma-glutamyltranspeptidase/glutathione hydrolase
LRQFEGSRAALLKPNGEVYRAGELLRQPDLARTYRAIAEEGIDWFYRGEFAAQVADWMEAHGGILTRSDFADYEAEWRQPIVTTYRGATVVGFPPPSSGGIHVAQILNILEHFDLAAIHRRNPVRAKHLLAEAMKLAFADRAHWLGDADFVRVPRGLIDKSYARQLAERIDMQRVTDVAGYSQPSDWQSNVFGKHTTHIAAVDAEGNWVGITATVNTSFGSKIVVPRTGVVLNNEMDDFSIQPGVPNAFGLIGAENNAVCGGKRPLSSMSPTIVLREGEPILTVGAAGGPKIITQVVLAIVRCLDYQLPLESALSQPRLHHQWRPNVLMVERGTPAGDIEQLMQLGHTLRFLPTAGVSQAAQRGAAGQLIGAHDPRVPGQATHWRPAAETLLEVGP